MNVDTIVQILLEVYPKVLTAIVVLNNHRATKGLKNFEKRGSKNEETHHRTCSKVIR